MRALTAVLLILSCRAYAQDDLARQAVICSDSFLNSYARKTCEPIPDIAVLAYQKCQTQWNAWISTQVGPAPENDYPATKDWISKRMIYEHEAEASYTYRARMTAIDARASAGNCGPH